MPELPEVQTTVNGLNRYVKGLRVKSVWTDYNSSFHDGKDNIKNPEYFKEFDKKVVGAKIIDTTRRGKNILIHLSSKQTIIIHMKMTGHLLYGRYSKWPNPKLQIPNYKKILRFGPKKSTNSKLTTTNYSWVADDEGPLKSDPFNWFIHFVITFTNKRSLALSDMRKFAKVTLVPTNILHESKHLKSHGPEPLDKDFKAKDLKMALMRRPLGAVKQILMNPEIIAGIGNIYSDEILWHIGVHPLERVGNISDKKWKEMYFAMRRVLKKGINLGGDSMSDYRNILGERGKFQETHNAYHRTGEKCRKRGCGGTIIRIKLGERSAHFCDKHQKLMNR